MYVEYFNPNRIPIIAKYRKIKFSTNFAEIKVAAFLDLQTLQKHVNSDR